MIEQIQTHDVVIGSRNIPGGGVVGWPFLRKLISKGGSLYARLVLGCPVRDLTGGFNMWRKTALEKTGLSSIISKGYSFQIEMKYKAYRGGCSITEIPIIFAERRQGVSKMTRQIFLEALLAVWEIKNPNLVEFIKFAITGGLGTITNLAIFFVCADLLGFHEIPVSVFCFFVAATQNYFINRRWSFKKISENAAPGLKQWALFTGASLAGLGVNIAVMKSFMLGFNPPYKFIAQACGIAAGMGVNFLLSKRVVFRGKRVQK
jgi:putative flippase GtrA